jgi:hypothetical protein
LELIPLTFIPLPVSGLRRRFHSLPRKMETASGWFSAAYTAVSNHFQSFPLFSLGTEANSTGPDCDPPVRADHKSRSDRPVSGN